MLLQKGATNEFRVAGKTAVDWAYFRKFDSLGTMLGDYFKKTKK